MEIDHLKILQACLDTVKDNPAWIVNSFGSVIAKAGTATGAMKDIPIKVINDYLKTLGSFAASTGLSVAADEAQAKGKK